MSFALPITIAILALVSILLSPKARAESGFFAGLSPNGTSPGLITMILSQVTTWIFARSLLNAAILGFYYGIWGTIAYAAYYLSFLTGGLIVDSLRFKHGFNSIPHSVYWTIVTLTTVGYGDISPETPLGQLIATLIMIIGYGIIAVPTGIVSAEYASSMNKANDIDEGRSCPNCSAEIHRSDAHFCRKCGYDIIDE